MIYVDGIALWLENCCRFKTLTVPNINSRFLFRCLSVSSPRLLFGDCFKIKKLLAKEKFYVIAGAGLGVPVADILSAPFTPPTFADAALHGGFS